MWVAETVSGSFSAWLVIYFVLSRRTLIEFGNGSFFIRWFANKAFKGSKVLESHKGTRRDYRQLKLNVLRSHQFANESSKSVNRPLLKNCLMSMSLQAWPGRSERGHDFEIHSFPTLHCNSVMFISKTMNDHKHLQTFYCSWKSSIGWILLFIFDMPAFYCEM